MQERQRLSGVGIVSVQYGNDRSAWQDAIHNIEPSPSLLPNIVACPARCICLIKIRGGHISPEQQMYGSACPRLRSFLAPRANPGGRRLPLYHVPAFSVLASEADACHRFCVWMDVGTDAHTCRSRFIIEMYNRLHTCTLTCNAESIDPCAWVSQTIKQYSRFSDLRMG